jgi:hypothetical protein
MARVTSMTRTGFTRSGVNQGKQVAAAGLLGAACCAWAAYPLAGALPTILLVLAAVSVLADLIRLTAAGLPIDDVDVFSGLGLRAARTVYTMIAEVPSAEVAVVALLVLEATHASRPWQTGVLGAALLCYLLATHLAESGGSARVLRPQLPALAAGLGLLILGAAAALVPAAAPSLASGLLRVLAAVAAIVAGALALPL